ncbi:MAG: gliding-motility protein MglA [Myxococcales bacterium]|nr:gliding-motility protein MglA [Myxococcales bacterium]
MSFTNFSDRVITFKLVYWGTGLGGKTTNVRRLLDLHGQEQPLLASHVQLELGRWFPLRAFRLRVFVNVTPGARVRDPSRALILRGADGIVFVCDSQASWLRSNVDSLQELDETLAVQGRALAELPHVVQYNKRDTPTALPLDQLRPIFNRHGAPEFMAVAREGAGVVDTFRAITRMMLARAYIA